MAFTVSRQEMIDPVFMACVAVWRQFQNRLVTVSSFRWPREQTWTVVSAWQRAGGQTSRQAM